MGAAGANDPDGPPGRTTAQDRHAGGDERHPVPAACDPDHRDFDDACFNHSARAYPVRSWEGTSRVVLGTSKLNA
jgi:hypothetical protein